ncbi:hypothetical protein F2P44_33795 [Massilia sp. CCM 8695]|uniref:Type III secretion system chaperone n=1 Tax=Massilia frigida TaxID=2609281 RepID=A0ABX0NKM9_9BURK|nr:hypothetical protein [Massilia frigida]NHZ84183.1 hypothetical protein [Massilia frigida]
MIDGFDMQLGKIPSRDFLLAALAKAYDIHSDEINLQYLHNFDLSAPARNLFCLVTENDENDQFPVLLTLSSCETELDNDTTTIASKLSDALKISAPISNKSIYDDGTMLMISGFEPPKLVILREEYDKILGKNKYFLESYD